MKWINYRWKTGVLNHSLNLSLAIYKGKRDDIQLSFKILS